MPEVAYKDLCIDTTDPERVAPYWSMLLALELGERRPECWPLRGEQPEHTVWINTVPEPKTAKSRVHLDVRLDGEPHGLDGTVLRAADDEIAWQVMADPDGLEWCAFGPREGAGPGPFELVVDCADPRATAQWWADRTGATLHTRPGADFVWLEGAAGFPWDYWVFGAVPEPRTVKNRVHWDVTLLGTTVGDLVQAGATVLDERPDWTVLADPEGNEFCAFAPTPGVSS